ncbi:MAG: VanZ family protein, partial [Lachnospiraceae bacterium]|nr:VanZ family protein [Lachnospiraceae bacterium]
QMTIEMENFLRKAAHFTEYLLLVVALRHGFVRLLREKAADGTDTGRPESTEKDRRDRETLLSCGFALIIAVLYAASDEFHQSFVPGRSCMLGDVGIDSLGALAGILLCLLPLICLQISRKCCKIKD